MDIYKAVLIFHVISGFSALFCGLIPIFSKKGSKLHITGGWVYFWAMLGVLITTIAMFSMKPERLLFLLLVGIFSFYVAFSGVRSVRFKNPRAKATRLDWSVAGLVSISGFIMILLSLYNFFIPDGIVELGVLFLVFGVICFLQAFQDLLRFKKLQVGAKINQPWILLHIAKMGGAYIATCTAFFVVNIHFLPPLVVWLTPTVIGSLLIARTIRKYKKRAKKAPKTIARQVN